MDKIVALFQSRRFWAAVAGLASIVGAETLGLDETEVSTVVLVIVGWIVGDSLKDTARK